MALGGCIGPLDSGDLKLNTPKKKGVSFIFHSYNNLGPKNKRTHSKFLCVFSCFRDSQQKEGSLKRSCSSRGIVWLPAWGVAMRPSTPQKRLSVPTKFGWCQKIRQRILTVPNLEVLNPDFGFLRVGIPVHKPYIHTAYIGEDSSIFRYYWNICLERNRGWARCLQNRKCRVNTNTGIIIWNQAKHCERELLVQIYWNLSYICCTNFNELVVSTYLKNISQNGNPTQVGVKIKKKLKPPPT